MATPEVLSALDGRDAQSLVIFGIEVCCLHLWSSLIQTTHSHLQSHICVLQSTLDFLERGYDVHVLADGVSSCNKEEVPFALARMRQAGAQITTSESLLFQLQRAYTLSCVSFYGHGLDVNVLRRFGRANLQDIQFADQGREGRDAERVTSASP